MQMTDEATPTIEERAKFYLQTSIWLVGYEATLKTVTGDDPMADGQARDAEDAIRNLSITFSEGVRRNMRNSREHGTHPTTAFQAAVESDWPDWVKVQLAESEHQAFTGGFESDWSDETKEYVTFLEDTYDVPR